MVKEIIKDYIDPELLPTTVNGEKASIVFHDELPTTEEQDLIEDGVREYLSTTGLNTFACHYDLPRERMFAPGLKGYSVDLD